MLTVTSEKTGSTTAVLASGSRIMSDSLMPFQPLIDEPSNILPSTKRAAVTKRAGTGTCCSLPRVSVNRRSANLAFLSCTSFTTSVGAIAPPLFRSTGARSPVLMQATCQPLRGQNNVPGQVLAEPPDPRGVFLLHDMAPPETAARVFAMTLASPPGTVLPALY